MPQPCQVLLVGSVSRWVQASRLTIEPQYPMQKPRFGYQQIQPRGPLLAERLLASSLYMRAFTSQAK